jgi:hypothetical protein
MNLLSGFANEECRPCIGVGTARTAPLRRAKIRILGRMFAIMSSRGGLGEWFVVRSDVVWNDVKLVLCLRPARRYIKGYHTAPLSYWARASEFLRPDEGGLYRSSVRASLTLPLDSLSILPHYEPMKHSCNPTARPWRPKWKISLLAHRNLFLIIARIAPNARQRGRHIRRVHILWSSRELLLQSSFYYSLILPWS